MTSHVLALPSGYKLDLNNLPQQATLEMLQACRDRIFDLEASHAEGQPKTPSKRVSASLPASSSKAMKPAQIAKEKKSIVKQIKKTITPIKFYTGWDRVGRDVKFSAERLPPEAAEQLLLMPRSSWSSATVSANLGANDVSQALSLSPGELTGSVWRKGGAIRCGRFGAVKAVRLGSAPLRVMSLKANYNVKSQRLTGSLECINDAEVMPSGKKRRRDNSESDEDPFPFSNLEDFL